MVAPRKMSSPSNPRTSMSWSNGEVNTFLSLLAQDRIQRELDGASRNEKIFQELAEAMATCGFIRSSKQCRDKLKKLKSEYRAVIVHNSRRGAHKRQWKWFPEMDAIYGKRPASNSRESVVDTPVPPPVPSFTLGNGQFLKALISERLTAAATDIFSEFEKTIIRYEREIDRQRRLLEINSHRTELPLHNVKNDEEVLTDQQLWNQGRTSSLDQEQPEPLQEEPVPQKIKVEQNDPEPLQILDQEELSVSQDEEQFVLKLEMVTSLATPTNEERDRNEPESNCDQLLSSVFPEAEIRTASHAASTACPEPPQHHVCEEEKVVTNQKLSNQEKTSSSDQKEPERPLIKEEQQELCISQHEGPSILTQENVTFMVTSSGETDCIEPEQNWNQPLCQGSTEAENQDQDGCKNEKSNENSTKNKRHPQTKDHRYSINSQKNKKQKRAHKGERLFSCGVCEKSFTHKHLLTHHMKSHTGEKPFTCETCGKCFSLRSVLINHTRVHTGEKPFTCGTCGKCFYNNHILTNHMRSHTGEKPFTCETCGKCFSYRGTLMNHMRSHTGEKPFTCETCGKCFPVSWSLTTHMKVHTGERPFICTICSKCFRNSYHLTSHMKTHTGEKPFTCQICDKCFCGKNQVTRHMRTHTGEKPFTCETCGKCFSDKGAMITHIRVHTGEKPFTCSICGKCFPRRNRLNIHIKTKHR